MTDQLQKDFNKFAERKERQRKFVVKGNKVLAAARKRLKDIANITLKAEIHGMLKQGLHGTCNDIEVKQLRLWCGMPAASAAKKPPAKKAAPKKRATVKKKVDNIQVKPKNGNANNGGARKNAGRKKGAATKKTREIADKLVADGDLTPLEYMLQTLRETPEKIKAQYNAGDLDTIQYTLALSNLTARRDSAAKDAASYIHPRLSSIEANVGLKGQDLFAALLEKEG